jgi:hypothetical protein
MKSMNLVLALAFLVVTNITFAQPQGSEKRPHQGPPPIPSKQQITTMVNQLAEEVQLSEDQKKTILELHTQHFEIVKEKMCENNPPIREEMEVLRKEFEKKCKDILTADQIGLYDAFMKNLHTKHQQGKHR